MPNQEKKVMSAQTLHKRPPKLHLGHDDKIHSATSSADTIGSLGEMNSCNSTLTTMTSSPSTPTTPSTPNSPAFSNKPPKKRYLENGSFRCNEDYHATPQMAKLMELAKVCSNTSKSTGSSSGDFPPGSSRDSPNDKQLGPNADFQVNISYNYSKSQASSDGDNLSGKVDASAYSQIPTFDVDIAGRIRDSDLFETSSSSSPSGTIMSVTRSEEPLNLCTDKKTFTTCQQDLISRMVDKFFCDPKESKGTLLDSFLLKMNSHKKLPQGDRGNKTNALSTRGENNSDGEEVECVGRFKGIKFHSNDRIGTPKVALGNADENGAVIHFRGEKKDNCENTENRGFLQRRSQTSTTSVNTKTVTNREKLTATSESVCPSGDDFVMETITPLKEGQRKSQRSSKGKRYKAFLTEGFLQPTKDRKQIRRNNGEEQIECEKPVKDADTKPSNRPNKKRKALEMRDEKGSTKERHSSEDKSSRENKGNYIQLKEDEADVHRLRKAKRKNFSTSEIQDSEKNIDENEEKPDYQYCCVRNASNSGNYLESQDIMGNDVTSKHTVLCDTQKSQSDENQKKRPIELLSNLNIDDSDSPPKLTRMDEDEDNGFEGKV